MNREESLALFARGRQAWNAWAEGRRAERRALEEAGAWIENPGPGNAATMAWHDTAAADFCGHEFKGATDFSGFVFPSQAKFEGASFSGDAWFNEAAFAGSAQFSEAAFAGSAWFNEASFAGSAHFGKALFSKYAWFKEARFAGAAAFNEAAFAGDAWFNEARFAGPARFNKARFAGDAEFAKAAFSGPASFLQTGFAGFTSFDDGRFEGLASYRAAQMSRAFSLARARFRQAPDFIQTRFIEAPRFDELRIEAPRAWPDSVAGVKVLLAGESDSAARWRALKRHAAAAGDHEHKLFFFKGEVLARRWSLDKPWQALFYCGLLYDGLSDFGRSVLRPLLGWVLGVLFFALCYLSQRPADAWACDAAPGSALTAAFGLSLRHAFVLPGAGSASRLDRIHACLYGVHEGAAAAPARFQPVIPDAVAFIGGAQSLWSALVIFLLFLALRNRFR